MERPNDIQSIFGECINSPGFLLDNVSLFNMSYKEIIRSKRAQRDSNFKKEWLIPEDQLPDAFVKDVLDFPESSGFLTPAEIEITRTNAVDILENIKFKKWSAYEVAFAFGHRATIAHQLTNCLTEVFFEEGLQTAKELDEYYEKTGQLKGPLHGLPISLKDNLNIKGYSSSIGIVAYAVDPPAFEEESSIVTILRDLGAVFYVKTNVPVALLLPDTDNHIWGPCVNPLNRSLSPGGSSGGEAALIALRGSPVGAASDIGGSIRIPASFVNCFGLKPTFGRMPIYGSRSGVPGYESISSVNGPISTSLKGIELYTKSLVDAEPWRLDPRTVTIPWRNIELPKTLKFAILKDDGVLRPDPAISRALEFTEKKLLEHGHEIIEWYPEDLAEFQSIAIGLFSSDGGKAIQAALDVTGEPQLPQFKLFGEIKDIQVSDLWKLQNKKLILIKRFLERWNATAERTSDGKIIDAIISPITPYTGVKSQATLKHFNYHVCYNLTDYTVGTIPVLRTDREIDGLGDVVARTPEEVEHFSEYNPEFLHGASASIQIIGRKFEEEKVIELMKIVSKAVGTNKYWGN